MGWKARRGRTRGSEEEQEAPQWYKGGREPARRKRDAQNERKKKR